MTHPSPPTGEEPAEPSAAVTQDDGEWHRLHPLSPLLRGGLVALVIAGIVIANLRDRLIGIFVSSEFDGVETGGGDVIDVIIERDLVLIALVAVTAIILLIVFFAWLSWRFHSYRITDEAVESRSGVVFRQHRRAPLDRIQSVNLQRSLLARMLGLTQVDVQTAGQGGKVALAYLGYRDAKTVREQILRRAEATREAGDPAAAVSSGPAALASTAAPDAGGLQPIDLDRRFEDFVDTDVDAEAQTAGTLVVVPAGRLIGSLLLSWELVVFVLLSIASIIAGIVLRPFFLTLLIPFALAAVGIGIRGFNRGWGFTLSRGADAVRVGAGLTATRTETLPLGRIHAVEARQPLFWRPFGWWQVRVTTAGHTAAEGGQGGIANVVLPVGLEADVLRVVETLLPGSVLGAEGEEELRDALLGSGRGFVPAGRGAAWVLWFARRRTGLRLVPAAGEPTSGAVGDPAALRIRRGALTRGLSIIPILRVQSVQLRRPLVHRALGLAAVQAHTVLGPVHTEMRGLALDRAREVFDLLAETVVSVQGAEQPHDRRTR